jgi:octaprenyl-diphosphate synthase
LRRFGRHLGVAFQLIDDLMDYTGDQSSMGKNVGDDLAEGKPTLPLIHAMAHATDDERKLIRKAIRQGSCEQIDKIQAILIRCGSLDYTRARATQETQDALECLNVINDSPYKQSLANLCTLALTRQN